MHDDGKLKTVFTESLNYLGKHTKAIQPNASTTNLKIQRCNQGVFSLEKMVIKGTQYGVIDRVIDMT